MSDIGGFYDGLNLLIRILLAPLSSALFLNDLVKGSVFTSKSSESLRATGKHAAYLLQGQAVEVNQTQSVLLNFTSSSESTMALLVTALFNPFWSMCVGVGAELIEPE